MSITSGFFNSSGGDRKYSAESFNSFFDGLIQDGIYLTYGGHFDVSDARLVDGTNGMFVYVDTGRAWFNHAWILNDAPYKINIAAADASRNRIDTIVIEVNKTGRYGTVKAVTGSYPSSGNPVPPTLTNDDEQGIYQYALADVRVPHGTDQIALAHITNRIGRSGGAPYTALTLDESKLVDAFNEALQDFEENADTTISEAIDEYLEENEPMIKGIPHVYYYEEGQHQATWDSEKVTLPAVGQSGQIETESYGYYSEYWGFYPGQTSMAPVETRTRYSYAENDLIIGSSGRIARVLGLDDRDSQGCWLNVETVGSLGNESSFMQTNFFVWPSSSAVTQIKVNKASLEKLIEAHPNNNVFSALVISEASPIISAMVSVRKLVPATTPARYSIKALIYYPVQERVLHAGLYSWNSGDYKTVDELSALWIDESTMNYVGLPDASSSDNGKGMLVKNGKWVKDYVKPLVVNFTTSGTCDVPYAQVNTAYQDNRPIIAKLVNNDGTDLVEWTLSDVQYDDADLKYTFCGTFFGDNVGGRLPVTFVSCSLASQDVVEVFTNTKSL